MSTITRYLPDDEATHSVGEKLSRLVQAPLRIYLSGPLGAGKTALVRSYLRALGVQGAIKSPSYALVEPYNLLKYPVYHFDFYRFFDQNEWQDSGFRDYFEENAVCLVEWPEKAGSILPPADVEIELTYASQASRDDQAQGRQLKMTAHTLRGESLLKQLEENQ